VLDWDKALQRNPLLTTNRISRADLIAMGSAFPVATLLDTSGLGKVDSVFVGEIRQAQTRSPSWGSARTTLPSWAAVFRR
jgi:putative endopeptidase